MGNAKGVVAVTIGPKDSKKGRWLSHVPAMVTTFAIFFLLVYLPSEDTPHLGHTAAGMG
jgi:hypothetical protein